MPRTDREPRARVTTCADCDHPTTAGHLRCDICSVFGPLDRSGSPQDRDAHRRANPSEPDHHIDRARSRQLLAFILTAYLLLLCGTVAGALHLAGLVTW